MNEHRRQILEMLAEGKVTAEEAERLIDALDRQHPEPVPGTKPRPKFLRVLVVADDGTSGDGSSRINIRVPLQLLRAGVRLTALVPPPALAKANTELARAGWPIDLTQLKPQHLDDLIEHLDDLTVDVDDPGSTVKVFCE
ncbi:SHOCT-like domain-containing protein [Catenuloplanes japonicus]|uniref:SHOCT-like domain-containing protein n=1 Tax=Catenuloplanes japonicus TaxID=33876 RepID=UPI000526E3D7|nr:hypothetical protein [Catenuloplanes japonicus]